MGGKSIRKPWRLWSHFADWIRISNFDPIIFEVHLQVWQVWQVALSHFCFYSKIILLFYDVLSFYRCFILKLHKLRIWGIPPFTNVLDTSTGWYLTSCCRSVGNWFINSIIYIWICRERERLSWYGFSLTLGSNFAKQHYNSEVVSWERYQTQGLTNSQVIRTYYKPQFG